MANVHDGELNEEGTNLGKDTPMVSIKKLGQYFKSDDSNVIIPISYHLLDGGVEVSILMKQCLKK